MENRYRLLQTIVRRAREAVGPTFPISVKLNSSDFQKGGFTQEESLTVIGMLDQEGIDLLEISGGTYENVVFFMMNEDVDSSTHKREAYFIDFATQVRKVASVPLLITGGFRSFDFCNKVLSHGELDLIGMVRPFITNLVDIPRFLTGALPELKNLIVRSGIKQFEDGAEGGYYARQIIRLAQGKAVDPRLRPLLSSLFLVWHELTMSMR